MKYFVVGSFVALLCTTVLSNKYPYTGEDKQTVVHLFEWKWTAVVEECFLVPWVMELFKYPRPMNEHRIILEPDRPWHERYQPVSYMIESRSGNRDEFVDMVDRCNKAGVRIYADVVINHMTGKNAGHGYGIGGNKFNASSKSYPAVPYKYEHFNGQDTCKSDDGLVHNYTNPEEVRNCNLLGLLDLRLDMDHVREMVTNYMNDLIDMSVAGFRIESAKYMWPSDLEYVYSKLQDLNTTYFPSNSQPFIYQEIVDLGDNEGISYREYTDYGCVTEFNYGVELVRFFGGEEPLRWLETFGVIWGFLKSIDALVFIDNHESQRNAFNMSGSYSIITHKEPIDYRMANAYMLAWDYGFTRLMSSYQWEFGWEGPPHDENHITKDVHDDEGNCVNGWVCEHRWRSTKNMVTFRNVVKGEEMSGLDETRHNGSYEDAIFNPCSIPIVHYVKGTNAKYNSWMINDDYLDWYGSESNQGGYKGIEASGSPMVWTTTNPNYHATVEEDGYGYEPYNTYTDHLWMLDVDMDCTNTDDEWFELKGYGGDWERNVNQWAMREGDAGGQRPSYNSGNHFGRCGYINVFTHNEDGCRIDYF
uniref:Alpha-amylase n=1 Tax=Saccoglossus kowalevskii TaxID=10224 RepID=A0ABM0MII2_SACKO|nr:PREDICTED: alpha-amylase-like [Saccoglossus kowalevskii]